MQLTSKDIATLMSHYQMTINPSLGICDSDRSSTSKLHSAGYVVDYDPSEINRPLTAAGLKLVKLIIAYANEV